jgi:hypothetical protein
MVQYTGFCGVIFFATCIKNMLKKLVHACVRVKTFRVCFDFSSFVIILLINNSGPGMKPFYKWRFIFHAKYIKSDNIPFAVTLSFKRQICSIQWNYGTITTFERGYLTFISSIYDTQYVWSSLNKRKFDDMNSSMTIFTWRFGLGLCSFKREWLIVLLNY